MAKRFIQNNFYTFASASLTVSVVSGWMGLNYIQDQQKQQHAILQQPMSVLETTDDPESAHAPPTRAKSREELRLQAMVENALKSSWRENLDNAFDAQTRFMLPGRDHGNDPEFLQKIDQRVAEKLKKQEKKAARRKKKEEKKALLAKLAKENGQDEPPSYDQIDDVNDDDEEGKGHNKIQFWK